MMTEAQEKAWNCLTEKEQNSLFLQLSQGKSSWEAGEMMKISHYKYLEIKDRSQKFFKMFADFYEVHSDLFRPNGAIEETFRDYMYACIEKRMKRSEASAFVGESSMLVNSVSQENIIRNMKRLKESGDSWDKDTWNLIMEFDRWNNHRILPRLIQQPSAFKRRVNKKYKIYIKYTLDRVKPWLHFKLRERFYYKVKPSKPKNWLCLVSEELYPEEGYYLLPVRTEQAITDEMSKFYLYVFTTRQDAEDFGFLVSRYRAKTANVRLGQGFWPTFIETIKKAVNYNEVNNIDFNVKALDNAYMEHRPKPKKKKKHSTGVERASDQLLNN